MADLPIPFSLHMVVAITDEIDTPGLGKTQTRRAHPPVPRFEPDGCGQPDLGGRPCWWDYWAADRAEVHRFKLPYAVGDRLYVRENWRTLSIYDGLAPSELEPRPEQVSYEADVDGTPFNGRLRLGMHMPRWASRITLLVTQVRVQRLHELTVEDAWAEGINRLPWSYICDAPACLDDPARPCSSQGCDRSIRNYAHLWDELHGKGAWDLNPWIAAYTFRPVKGNIDRIGKGWPE